MKYKEIIKLIDFIANKEEANLFQLQKRFQIGKNQLTSLIKSYEQITKKSINRGKALDFGCGFGKMTNPLCEIFKRVIGIDISEDVIRVAKNINQFPTKCEYYNNKNGRISFGDNIFDLILCFNILHMLELKDVEICLSDCFRSINKQGVVILNIGNQKNIDYIIPKTVKNNPGVFENIEKYKINKITDSDIEYIVKQFNCQIELKQIKKNTTNGNSKNIDTYVYFICLKQ